MCPRPSGTTSSGRTESSGRTDPCEHPLRPLRIYSWNVNGLRACARKGFLPWLAKSRAHIVAVQEVRAPLDKLEDGLRSPGRWHSAFVAAEKKGYSGVGLYSRRAPDSLETSLGVPAFDVEGRLQMASFGDLLLVNGYFPNGSGPNRDHSRVPYKLRFYRRVFEQLEVDNAKGRPILVMGDFNTAHAEVDLARPKQNKKTSGFLPEEREELDRWLRSGWVDTFRAFDERPGNYTWWSQRFGVREKNIGWRIDYVLANEAAMAHVKKARIHPRVLGSDHCPISVDLDPAIFGDKP